MQAFRMVLILAAQLQAQAGQLMLSKIERLQYQGEAVWRYRPLIASIDGAAYWKSEADIRWIFGGNQSSKTYSNMMDLTKTVLGINPCLKRNIVGDHWAGIETWDMVRDVLWEQYLQKFIPGHHIKHIRWGQNKTPHKLFLDTGHTIEFKAFNQGRATFQGRAIQSAHYDEQCLHDFQGIFQETQARLMTKQGYLSWSMTPIVPQVLLEERIEDLPATDEIFYFNLNDNRISQGGYIEDQRIDDMIAEWPEEVQATRIEGKFASFYGSIYRTFSRSVHVIKPFKIPADWTLYRGIDFGYTNPFVCLWIARDHDDNWYVYREYYKSKVLDNEHIANVRARSGHEVYENTYGDPEDPKAMQLFRNSGVKMSLPRKDVWLGIEVVQTKLKVKPNGKPSLYILNTCPNTCREMAIYQHNEKKDTPLDKDNHTCFIAGTLVETSEGPKPIEKVKVGDSVLTRHGYHQVVASGMTCSNANIMTAEFSNGVTLTGTPDHRIFIKQKDFISLDSLRYNDIVLTLCETKKLYSKAYLTEDTQILSDGQIECITEQAIIENTVQGIYIERYGKMLMGKFLKDLKYIILMKTLLIMNWIISSAKKYFHIKASTQEIDAGRINQRISNIWKIYAHLLLHGTDQKKVVNGIDNMPKILLGKSSHWLKFAINAVKNTMTLRGEYQACFALMSASQHIDVRPKSIMKSEFVPFAKNNFQLINTASRNVAPENVVVFLGVKKTSTAPVYNITVDIEHEFFANGILVSNCDALRYVLYTVCRPRKKGTVVAS